MSGINIWKKNLPQTISMIPGSCIFTTGGLNLALSVGWNPQDNFTMTLQFFFCWLIGVIFGAIIAAPLTIRLPKHLYFKISAVLIVIGSIICISVPYNEAALIAARYINGIAIGFATVAFIIHASEIAAKSYRGTCLTTEQCSLAFGICIQVIIASQWSDEMISSQRLLGIIELVLGTFAFASAFYIIESPIFHIRRGNDIAALECLRCLQLPGNISDVTKALLEEHRLYVFQNQNLGYMESFAFGWIPLIKLSLYRGLVALTFSMPLTNAVVYASAVSLHQEIGWTWILYVIARFLGTLIMLLCLDVLGRKWLSNISLLISAGLIIAIGCLFSSYSSSSDYDTYMTIVVSLSLLYQLFAGMFVPSSSVYLGEAFPLLVKPYMIATVLIVENVVQIIVICAASTFSEDVVFEFTLSIGVISAILFFVFGATMPETRKTTLQEAQTRSNQVINLKLYQF